MKVKNFCKRLVGDYKILFVDSVDPESESINIYECCQCCAAEEFGDRKISQILIDDDEITLISEESGIVLKEADDEDYDEDYDDDMED